MIFGMGNSYFYSSAEYSFTIDRLLWMMRELEMKRVCGKQKRRDSIVEQE